MFFRNLSVFFRKHTVNGGTRWLTLVLIAVATAAVLSGCQPHH